MFVYWFGIRAFLKTMHQDLNESIHLHCRVQLIYISMICTQSVLFSPFEDAGGPDDPESEN